VLLESFIPHHTPTVQVFLKSAFPHKAFTASISTLLLNIGSNPQIPTQSFPKAPSSMASVTVASSESQPASSHSTQTTFPNTSTTSLASTLSTLSTTSTCSTIPKWNIHKPQYDAKGQKLDAMSRKYPVFEEQLSLDEMIALPPLPKSFRYEIRKDDVVRRKEESEENGRQELEDAKKMLRDLALDLKWSEQGNRRWGF
jgi:hypothetical protein